MTLAELSELIGDRPVARHRGQVFFTVRTEAEAKAWGDMGASVRPFAAFGRMYWEVHPLAMIEPELTEDADGELIDVTGETLLAYFRERDGWSQPFPVVAR